MYAFNFLSLFLHICLCRAGKAPVVPEGVSNIKERQVSVISGVIIWFNQAVCDLHTGTFKNLEDF